MHLGLIERFAATDIGDVLARALIFTQGAGPRDSTRSVILGRHIGFAGTLTVAVAAARGTASDDEEAEAKAGGSSPLLVAAVTFAIGGDNIGVYVPVFASVGGMTVYVAVFLLLVAVECFAGRFFSARPVIAEALSHWGHILLPWS
ncbi:cadmium resistance transporter [Streptomyces sp. NPDC004976]